MIINDLDNIFVAELKLHEFGFRQIEYSFDYNTALFVHEINGKYNFLNYGYGYDYRGLDKITFSPSSFNSWISFNHVENILKKILEVNYSGTISTVVDFRERNFHSNILTVYDRAILEPSLRIIFENKKIQYGTIRRMVKETYEYLSTYHFPFFERLSSLQVVNDEIIDKVPQIELGNYIPGQYMNLKKLIIMKLCDNSKYEEFKIWLNGVYEQMMKDEPNKYEEKYLLIQSLTEYLDSGKYKELM